METPAVFNLGRDLNQSFISLFCFWRPGSLLKERLPSPRFPLTELRKLNENSAGCTLQKHFQRHGTQDCSERNFTKQLRTDCDVIKKYCLKKIHF